MCCGPQSLLRYCPSIMFRKRRRLAPTHGHGPESKPSNRSYMATMEGAPCLARGGGRRGAGIAVPLGTLVFGAPALDRLWVAGRGVVSGGELVTADAAELAAGAAAPGARGARGAPGRGPRPGK